MKLREKSRTLAPLEECPRVRRHSEHEISGNRGFDSLPNEMLGIPQSQAASGKEKTKRKQKIIRILSRGVARSANGPAIDISRSPPQSVPENIRPVSCAGNCTPSKNEFPNELRKVSLSLFLSRTAFLPRMNPRRKAQEIAPMPSLGAAAVSACQVSQKPVNSRVFVSRVARAVAVSDETSRVPHLLCTRASLETFIGGG